MATKTSSGKVIHFYFDYVSPYSYLAYKNLQNLLRGSKHKLELKPVFLFNILQHWKQPPPISNKAKQKWIVKDAYRHSSMNSIPFQFPPQHPFNSIYALRASVYAAAGDRQNDLVEALFNVTWNPNESFVNLSNKEELNTFLTSKGFDAPGSSEEQAKAELEKNVQEALEAGVFGVPSMVVDGQVFWGCDQLPYVMETLQGMDPLDNEETKRRCNATLKGLQIKL
ncbi:thioredoxin-like protein [Basidiobolus meristosporus CBS 931.73]|uniref:Glutathione S-transferase kappa n=1 Tax=Basidiobolus meristosporus CBS 931.73 TaxID=1314790 RepID=A0A1Y1Z2S7_9FUNG|nr:thioredoxin-like protein [Basidiobolus meristosporus CBS 931.73]|eukprot:ORY04591.1 thioredoxin-like protein [Basidiobolus meristosporus CBS 931.73]